MKKIVTALSLSVLFISAQAQNAELKNLINRSFSYFPKIKEAENTIVTAENKLELTKTDGPVVSATGSYSFVAPVAKVPFPVNGETKEIQFMPNHNYNAGVNANYTLFDWGRLKANVERAKTDIQLAKDNVEAAKAQVANQVAMIYYNIVYFKKAISIQDSVLAYLNDNKNIVEKKLKEGDALRLDLLNIQANIDAEENRKVDLQNALQKQMALLSYTTGVSNEEGNSFDFNLTVADENSALANAVKSHPDFLVANDRIKQSMSDIDVIKLQDKPSVGINGGTGFKNGYQPDIQQFRFNYFAGISINIPLYTAGKTNKQIKVAESVVKQNQLAVQSLTETYKKDIDQTFSDIQANINRIENTAGQIESAKAAQTIAASRLKNGVGINIEVINASANLQRAALTRLQYEYQLTLAKIELARLTGVPYWK